MRQIRDRYRYPAEIRHETDIRDRYTAEITHETDIKTDMPRRLDTKVRYQRQIYRRD